MKLEINPGQILIYKTETDLKTESWFDAVSEQDNAIVLIKENTSSHIMLTNFKNYKYAFKLSNQLNQLWLEMIPQQIMIIQDGLIRIVEHKPNVSH